MLQRIFNYPVQRLIFLDTKTASSNAVLIVPNLLIDLECTRILTRCFFLRSFLIFKFFHGIPSLFFGFFIAGHHPFRAILIVAQPFVNRNRLLVIFGFLQRNGLLIGLFFWLPPSSAHSALHLLFLWRSDNRYGSTPQRLLPPSRILRLETNFRPIEKKRGSPRLPSPDHLQSGSPKHHSR